MTPRQHRQYYCRCGTYLAKDNTERQCACCQRDSRDKLITPPEVSATFWQTKQFDEAFAAQHIGRVFRAYRTHSDHYVVYGPDGISQTLLGQWLGLGQAQVSRIETGRPVRDLDLLVYWTGVLKIPASLLWFRLPEDKGELVIAEPSATDVSQSNGPSGLLETSPNGVEPNLELRCEHTTDPEPEPVLVAPWNRRGTVDAVVVLSGGVWVKRRTFIVLTGPALTAPAHQWLVHEPEPLVSGLAGRRVSGELVSRFSAMVTELRRTDDVAGGGSVLAMAQQLFAWVSECLDRASYSEDTGQALHIVLAELGQFCGWLAYDDGDYALAQRYYIAGLRAAHTADDRSLGAHILATMANQAVHQGQPTEAVTMIETALVGTRRHATPALLAELHLRWAQAYAASRDASACTAAISQARTHAEQLKPDDDPAWLYWLDPAAITVNAGTYLLELGQPEQAAILLNEGIAQFSAPFVRDRQIYVTHLADALARPGKQHDLDGAVALGMQSLELSESLDSTRGLDHLRNLYLRLKPHGKVPAVREFLERMEGLQRGANN